MGLYKWILSDLLQPFKEQLISLSNEQKERGKVFWNIRSQKSKALKPFNNITLWKAEIDKGTSVSKLQSCLKESQQEKPPSGRLDLKSLDRDLMMQRENILGAAQYGTVYLTKFRNHIVAVKEIRDVLQGNRNTLDSFRAEINLACTVSFLLSINSIIQKKQNLCVN